MLVDNKEKMYELTKILLDYVQAKGTHQIDENTTIDAAEYTDPERFKKEKNGLFRTTPLMLAFSCELPEPGSFRVNEDTGMSVLLTRTDEGKVKAFLNMCTHRGAKLTEQACGKRNRFTCPFHAWTFSNNGDLLAINQEAYFGEQDKTKLGLVELPCDEKYGMIFVILTPGMTMDIDNWFGGAKGADSEGVDYISGWHFERNTMVTERDLKTVSNWKIVLDTFCEGYHFPVLHAKDFDYKVHYCAHHWRFGPDNRHWAVAWPSQSIEELRDKPQSQWGNPQEHFSIIHYIYPNTIIGVYPQTCAVWHLYPGNDVDDQVTRMKYYSRVDDPSEEEKTIINDRFELFYKVVQTEDYWVSSGIHQNLASGLGKNVVLGRNEAGVAWMHRAINNALNELP
jgi:phenylpropionate dioxygenase-like ring-hydroxylating dioxygenase large terminal subunit